MDISDNQAREVLWASSDEGKAQLRAAWAHAVRLGLDRKGVTMADVGAILWVVHETVHETVPEDLSPGRAEFRKILGWYIARGAPYTMTLLRARLGEAGFEVPRETLASWLSADTPVIAAVVGQEES